MQPDCITLDTDSREEFLHSTEVTALRQYQNLKAVCSRFREVLSNNPEIPATLVLCKAGFDTPGLSRWLGINTNCGNLTVFADGALDVLLHSLLSLWFERLEGINLARPTYSSLTSLCGLKTLIECTLHLPSESVLDVQAPTNLDILEDLTLQAGTYQNLHLSSSLTSLAQYDSHVTCIQTNHNALQDMVISQGSQLHLPNDGVGACTALMRLVFCYDSIIESVSPLDSYVFGSSPPAAMSQLLGLTRLSVSVTTDKVDLAQFQPLRHLRRLHLILNGTSLITGGWLQLGLSSLTELRVTTFPDETLQDLLFQPAVIIGLHWRGLHSLESVTITGPATFNSSLIQLYYLPKLRDFKLVGFRPGNQKTLQQLATLKDGFAVHRPNVQFSVDELDNLPVGLLDADTLEQLH